MYMYVAGLYDINDIRLCLVKGLEYALLLFITISQEN
jgi:hypothetical protein